MLTRVKDRKPIWVPQKGSQEIFMASAPVFEVLYEGERGPGKTDALLMSYGQFVDLGFGPAWQGIIFRKTFPELKDIITKSKRWFPQIFPRAEYNEGEHSWRFPGGEKLYFAHMRTPDDYWKYHGHEYPFIGWEELTTFIDDVCYRRMMSCCRSSAPHSNMPRMYRATTNPYGAGHNWVKRRFRLPGHRFQVFQEEEEDPHTGKIRLSKPRLAIHGKLTENKLLLENDPDYIQTLRESARNEQELKAWIEGSWDIVSGGMFSDIWNEKVHVKKPFTIPASWRVDRAFDWGGSKPFSLGWYAESDGTPYTDHDGFEQPSVAGDIFRIGEWYGTSGKANEGLGLTSSEIADGALEKQQLLVDRKIILPRQKIWAGPADHNIFTQDRGASMHSEMARKGITFLKADKGPFSRTRGWEEIRKLLKHAIPPDGPQPREEPGLYIFDTCKYFLDLVPNLPRSDKDPDDIDTEIEDHIADELRYRVRRVKRGMKAGSF